MSTSKTLSVKDFLGSSSIKSIVVPQYQRNFSWSAKQLDDLWNDISAISIDSSGQTSHKHFLGLLVLVETDVDRLVSDIVDGQQRLTSITILLAVIRDVLCEISHSTNDQKIKSKVEKIISSINPLIFVDTTADRVVRKFIPNSNDKKFFNDLTYFVSGEDDAREHEITKIFFAQEKKDAFDAKLQFLKKEHEWKNARFNKSLYAYKFFLESIKKSLDGSADMDKIKYLSDLKTKCIDGIQLMVFSSTSESDAFNLFETLNDRGLGLAAADLIKNKILQRSKEADRDACSRKWDDIFGLYGKVEPGSHNLFLRHYYNCQMPFVTKQDLYSGYNRKLRDIGPDKVIDWLSDIEKSADDFNKFKNVFSGDTIFYSDHGLQNILLFLKKTGSVQWYSVAFPLMKILREEPELKQEVTTTYWLLFNLILRFLLLDMRFNHLEKRLPKIARSLWGRAEYSMSDAEDENPRFLSSNKEALKYAQKKLIELIENFVPDDKLFPSGDALDGPLSTDIKDNSIANILLRLKILSTLHSGKSLNLDLTLEHVLPVDHSKWIEATHYAESVKYKLGNYILIKGDVNSSVQNKPLKEKIESYTKERIFDVFDGPHDLSVFRIKDSNGWDQALVQKRTQEIFRALKPLISNLNFNFFR